MINNNKKQLSFYVLNYWHFILIGALICVSINEFKKNRYCSIKIINPENVKLYLASSNDVYSHLPKSQFSNISFDSFRTINNNENIFQKHWSAWYKIRIDSIPEDFTLDFYNFETVIGLDKNGQSLSENTVETASASDKSKRHIFFSFQKNDFTQICFFKVLAKTKRQTGHLEIRLIKSNNFLKDFYFDFFNSQINLLLRAFCVGIIFFQAIYMFGLVWSRRKLEYVYYFTYAITSFFYVIILHRFDVGNFTYSKILPSTQIIGFYFILNFLYFGFIRNYLSTKNLFPFLNTQLKNCELFLLIGFFINFLLFLFFGITEISQLFFLAFINCTIILNIYVMGLLFFIKNPLVKFIRVGYTTIALTLFIKIIVMKLQSNGLIGESLFFDDFILVCAGILDAICFNLGLNYKHRLENIESQNALLNERRGITSDLHDDLGSGLSNIKLLSERVQTSLLKVENKWQIEKISLQASELIDNLSVIVWSLDMRYDKLSNLIEQMKDYTATLSDIQTFKWEISPMESSILNLELSPKSKKNIFLIFKESINNAVKYADSEIIKIGLDLKNEQFIISIQDYGKGFDKNKISHNFGLNSIESRSKILGGSAEIISKINEGTLVKIQVTLPI